MAGHSKWSNIKHRKQAVDNKKSAVFQSFINQIRMIARDNNNPDTNYQLKNIIQKAKKLNCPTSLINKALEKKMTDTNNTWLYEIKFARQISLLIKIKTAAKSGLILSQIRRIVNRFPAELLSTNSILFEFEQCFVCETTKLDDEKILQLLENIDIKSIVTHQNHSEIILSDRNQLRLCKDFLNQNNILINQTFEKYVALQKITVDPATLLQYQTFCAKLTSELKAITFYDNLKYHK